MAAGSTYTPIATNTLGSAAASYTFSSIPSTYTDLVLIVNARLTSAEDASISLRFNGDSGTNYSESGINSAGSSATSFRESNINQGIVGSIGELQSSSIINISNYSNTTTYKSMFGRGNTTAYRVRAFASLWRSNSAINSITVLHNGSSNFVVGSTFTLYGITAA